MNTQNYIADTLELPSQVPLFRYNVNFNGVKKLLQQSNIQTNANSQSITKINEQMKSKYTIQQFKAHQKILNNSIKFGLNVQKYVDKEQNKFMQIKIDPKEQKSNAVEFGDKMAMLNQIVDFLLMKTSQNQEKIDSDGIKRQNLINETFKRLQNKIQSSVQTMGKTINNYFNQANKKSSGIESEFNMLKLSQDNKIKEMQNSLNNKISDSSLDMSLEAFKHRILKQISVQIQGDKMKRLGAIDQYNNQLRQFQRNMDLQNKLTKQKVSQLQQKVKAALGTRAFQIQKHKIYDKLSQLNSKADDLTRKNGQFIQFRRTHLSDKQKTKQQIIGISEQIKKLNDKQTSFKKMQNIGDILQKLDPHLICEVANQVKLHEKQIGNLEKKVMLLQTENRDMKNSSPKMPQVNAGQNSQMIQKILKQYTSNMDFEGRIKKVQRDVQQISKRTDIFHDLQKKIYHLSKDLDVGAIMKQLKRKCDQETTRKQFKIYDTKIQSLFDYFKTLRRQLQVIYKRTAMNSMKDSPDNPSLTSKKLFGASCISCNPSNKRKVFSRQKLDFSLEQSNDYLKSTALQKFK